MDEKKTNAEVTKKPLVDDVKTKLGIQSADKPVVTLSNTSVKDSAKSSSSTPAANVSKSPITQSTKDLPNTPISSSLASKAGPSRAKDALKDLPKPIDPSKLGGGSAPIAASKNGQKDFPKPVENKILSPKPDQKTVANDANANSSVNTAPEKKEVTILKPKEEAKVTPEVAKKEEDISKPAVEEVKKSEVAASSSISVHSAEKPVASNEVQVVSSGQRAEVVKRLSEPPKLVSRWKFWKRASQRDEQLTRISEGYVELVDMVRCIRDQADAQYENNIILRDSLKQLPTAIQSLQDFGKSQELVVSALDTINTQMKQSSSNEQRMEKAMLGLNGTLKEVGDASRASTSSFDKVQERMRDSDIRMENLFNNVRKSEEKVSDTMMRLQRNMSIIQGFFLFCMLCVIGGLIYIILNRSEIKDKVTPSIQPTEAPKSAEAPEPVDAPEPIESPKPLETAKLVEKPEPVEELKPVEAPKPVEESKPAEVMKPIEIPEPAETPLPLEVPQPEPVDQ